ncbi:MAG: DUF3971 domain-containing protein [Pseudomonadota bacterium]
MKLRLARVGVIAAEAVGVVVAALLAATAFLFWRVQAAPVDLDWSAPAFRLAANSAGFDNVVRRIDKIRLSKVGDKGGYRLDFVNVSLGGKRMGASAELPKVETDFYPADLLGGKIGPRRITVDGAALRIVRRSDKKLKLDFGDSSSERATVFKTLTGGAYFRQAFERAALSDATITFVDESSGRTWIGRSGEAVIERTDAGYTGSLNSNFEIGNRAASLSFTAIYDLKSEAISSELSLVDAPVGDLIAVFFNENAELFTSPVSGTATMDIGVDGAVRSSRIDLHAGSGELTLGGWSTAVNSFAAAAAFDPAKNEFSVDEIKWDGDASSGSIAGTISLIPATEGKGIGAVKFTLENAPITINQPAFFEAPWTVDRSAIDGAYDVSNNSLSISELSAEFFGVSLNGGVAYSRTEKLSPAVKADLRLNGSLDPQTLLKFWPKKLVLSARDFVATRMTKGKLSDVSLSMDLPSGAIAADGALPDDALSLKFRADDAQVFYAPEMTPLVGVSGRGLLTGNSFRFDAEKAQVGKVAISKGQVDIPVLSPKGAPAFFRFRAAGDAGELLAILNEDPLKVLSESKFAPEQFSGPVSAQVEIQRPNLRLAPPESYRYKGVATFDALVVDDIIGDASLTGGKGQLDLDTDGMLIKGEARLGDAPLSIEWRQRFFGKGDKTLINVNGVANSATADLFGIPTRQMVQGDIPFSAKAVGGVDAFRALDLEVDLTKTILIAESLGWLKPQGAPAKGLARFAFSPEGTKVDDFSIEGDGISIAGEADFIASGALKTFALPTFKLANAANLAMTGRRDENGALLAEVSGEYLNAGEMIRRLIDDGAGGDDATPFALKARIDRVDLRADASFSDAAFDFGRSGGKIDALEFSATGAGGKKLSVALNPATGVSGEQTIEARSDDVGEMLAGIFAITSVKGGNGWLDFAFTPGAESAPKTGRLAAHDLRVVKAPLLAKIFAAGSLTGLADLMNGDGIELKKAMARFAIEDGAVRVFESRATGPSVGITAQGAFGLDGERAVTLKGAVAPAYGVNSLLGKTPVIGDLFVSRKGEGVLALSYDVAGPASEPRVTVNPLSAFTPGVFRRMFEGRAAAEEDPSTDEAKAD